MLGMFKYDNNVRTTLSAPITSASSDMSLDGAVAPFRNPPVGNGIRARFTIVDNPANPSMVEVIEVSEVSIHGSGAVNMSGAKRGLEGTTAQDWPAGSVIFQAVTQEMLNPAGLRLTEPEFVLPGAPGMFVEAAGHAALRPAPDSPSAKLDITASTLRVTDDVVLEKEVVIDGLEVLNMAVSGQAGFSGRVTIQPGQLRVLPGAPASSTAAGSTGMIRVDANYIYVCTGNNTWKRVALSNF